MNRKRKLENNETGVLASLSVGNVGNNSEDSDISEDEEEDIPQHVVVKNTYSKAQYFRMIQNGEVDQFRYNITRNELLTYKDYGNYNCLHKVVAMCDNEVKYEKYRKLLKFILTKAPELLMEKGTQGDTPLCFACKIVCHHQVISRLVKTNPKALHVSDEYKVTPLHYVASLLGQRKSVVPYHNMLPVQDNLITTSIELCKLFIKKGADVNAEDSMKNGVIHWALKQSGIYIDCKNEECQEYYHIFVNNMLELLLRNGATLRSKSGKHAICNVYSELEAKWVLKQDPKLVLHPVDSNINVLEYFFNIRGINCTENENIVLLLIKNGARPQNYMTLMIARNSNCKFSILEALLQFYPGYDLKSTNKRGETILTQYGKDVNTIEKLLKMGVDPTSVDKKGNTALTVAAKGKNVEAIRKLLNLGTDPSLFSKPLDCVLIQICREFRFWKCNLNIYYKLLKDILNHPKFKITPISESFKSVIIFLIDDLMKYQHWHTINPRLKDIITILLNANKDIRYMQITPNEKHKIQLNGLTFKPPTYDIFGYTFERAITFPFLEKIDQYINILINIFNQCGFSTTTTPSNCITILTLQLLYGRKLDSKEQIHLKLLEKKEMNLESRVLERFSDEKEDKLKVPDALLMSILTMKKKVTKELLSHYWGPPISLLLLPLNDLQFTEWCPILLEYGGLPHGTMMFKQLQNDMNRRMVESALVTEKCNIIMESEVWTSPISLQDLCKYKVRELVADKVTETHTSLPDLLHDLLPPLLRNVVIH